MRGSLEILGLPPYPGDFTYVTKPGRPPRKELCPEGSSWKGGTGDEKGDTMAGGGDGAGDTAGVPGVTQDSANGVVGDEPVVFGDIEIDGVVQGDGSGSGKPKPGDKPKPGPVKPGAKPPVKPGSGKPPLKPGGGKPPARPSPVKPGGATQLPHPTSGGVNATPIKPGSPKPLPRPPVNLDPPVRPGGDFSSSGGIVGPGGDTSTTPVKPGGSTSSSDSGSGSSTESKTQTRKLKPVKKNKIKKPCQGCDHPIEDAASSLPSRRRRRR